MVCSWAWQKLQTVKYASVINNLFFITVNYKAKVNALNKSFNFDFVRALRFE